MTPTSHRRCQYRGEGCTGMAHAGFDQCGHCYYQFVKPALQAEKAEMKRRRAIKRGTLMSGNGALGGTAEQPGGTQAWITIDNKPSLPSMNVRDAVSDHFIHREIDRAIADDKDVLDVLGDKIVQHMIDDDLPILKPTAIRRGIVPSPLQKEPLPVPEPEPPTLTRHVHAGGKDSHLTEAQVVEVIDAYTDGMTVTAICDVCNIATTTLYAILREKHIPLRGRNYPAPSVRPGTWALPVPVRRPLPLRRTPVMPQVTAPVSPEKGEMPSANGAIAPTALTEWVVTYTITRTETTIVAARDFNAAAASITDGDVISVAKKLP